MGFIILRGDKFRRDGETVLEAEIVYSPCGATNCYEANIGSLIITKP